MENIAIAIAVVTGLTEVVKRLGINTRYIPLTAVILGALYSGLVTGFDAVNLTTGVIVGLTSAGLYRTVQKTVK